MTRIAWPPPAPTQPGSTTEPSISFSSLPRQRSALLNSSGLRLSCLLFCPDLETGAEWRLLTAKGGFSVWGSGLNPAARGLPGHSLPHLMEGSSVGNIKVKWFTQSSLWPDSRQLQHIKIYSERLYRLSTQFFPKWWTDTGRGLKQCTRPCCVWLTLTVAAFATRAAGLNKLVISQPHQNKTKQDKLLIFYHFIK